MKVSEECKIAASQGNQVIGMIQRNIRRKYKESTPYKYKELLYFSESFQ